MNTMIPLLIILAISAMLIHNALAAERYEPEEEETEPDCSYDDLGDQIEEIYATKCRMDELEQMMTDLQTCDPDKLQKSFRCNWQTTAGNNLQHDFWATGKNRNTEYLYRMAMDELQELRCSLLNQIENLYECSHGNGHGND